MLPLPNLDDRTFEQIVEEAVNMIHSLAPDWTDENYHDPGITFIDMFAWLAEMQQYYLNRVTAKNELKFLKLLGIKLREAVSSVADVSFEGVPGPIRLPAGTRLAAGDQPFETLEPVLLLPGEIEKILVFTDTDTTDCTSSNGHRGVTYYAFGREAKAGSRFYIGFDRPLPPDREICLTLHLFEDYPVPAASCFGMEPDIVPSARVSWNYYGISGEADGQSPGWLPLEVRDDTLHLTRSGRVYFTMSAPMLSLKIHPANERGRYWICCTVEQAGYEIPPRVDKIMLNTVAAAQRRTRSRVVAFSGTGEPGQFFVADDYLSYYGLNEVQVQDQEGNWRYWPDKGELSGWGPGDAYCAVFRDSVERKTTLKFGDGRDGMIPPQGKDNIRLISYEPAFRDNRFLGQSSGLPNQIFRLEGPQIIGSSLMLHVGIQIPGSLEYVWQDWIQVDDFDASAPGDRHFMFKAETGEIIFGNNESGLIPAVAGDGNIRVISCQTGGGSRGNVKDNEINKVVGVEDELRELTLRNRFFAAGGAERDTLEEARQSLLKDLKKQYRAVTCEDYENIARSAPGLRVARVKALPLYVRGLQGYPENKAPAQLTVVVVPYSEESKPVPSQGFLETVRRHLDKYRLITTEIQVIPPEYIKITVHAEVVVTSNTGINPGKIKTALDSLLNPLGDYGVSKGWPFGRPVYKGDIYGVINRIEGVEYIKELWLNAEGTGARKEPNGNIEIPPYGLVYPGEHEIEIVSRDNL